MRLQQWGGGKLIRSGERRWNTLQGMGKWEKYVKMSANSHRSIFRNGCYVVVYLSSLIKTEGID